MAGRLTFCFELLPALARPVLSISPVRPFLLYRARQCSILFCSIFILFCLFSPHFFGRVIFRQPLALCCVVARRRRVSARIARRPWHRFIIAITPGVLRRARLLRERWKIEDKPANKSPVPSVPPSLARQLDPSVCGISHRECTETHCSPPTARAVINI